MIFFGPRKIFSLSLILKRHDVVFLAALVAFAGVVVQAAGGTWDGQTHLAREVPEQFWSIQHLVVYAGLAMVVCSSAFGFLALVRRRQKNEKALQIWLAVISLGAGLELFSGYFDMRAHEINGLDAMVTPSHVGLHAGIFIVSLGCFLVFSRIETPAARRMIPAAIATVFFSAAWIAFNLIMSLAPALMCLPIYELLSSGCEVL